MKTAGFGILSAKFLAQKKGELLRQLSRSSGCIYLTQYTILGVRGNQPFFTDFGKGFVKIDDKKSIKETGCPLSSHISDT